MAVKNVCVSCEKEVKKNAGFVQVVKMDKINGVWIQFVKHC